VRPYNSIIVNKNWKYISLYFAGDRFDYIYDQNKNTVYTQDFPGIEVQPFTVCRMRITPDILKSIIVEKLANGELQRTQVTENYENLF
jgi:hypothetical protein